MFDFIVEERRGLGGETTVQKLSWENEEIGVADLIRLKLRGQISQDRSGKAPRGLPVEARLDPISAEAVIEEQVRLGLKAMASNAIFLFADDQQISDPNATITLTPDTRIEFLRIIPLKGG